MTPRPLPLPPVLRYNLRRNPAKEGYAHVASVSRSQRYRQIVSVVIEEGFGTVLDQLGMRASWIASMRAKRSQGEDANLSPEQRVRRTMERLGPTFSKIGQMLSVRPDLIPPSYAAELAKLQDEMEPFGFEQVRVRDRGILRRADRGALR